MIWQGSNNYHFTLIKKVLTGEPLITGTTVEPPLSGCLMDVHYTCKLAWQEHTSLYFQGGGGSSITEKKPNQVYQSLYVVLGPWKSAMSLVCDFSENDKINISSRNKNTLNNERYRDLLISILSYDKVLAFLLLVKARNKSLLAGRLICLSWSLDFCVTINYMVIFT